MAHILVLGLGNPMMGDDGLGPAVVEELLRCGLPGNLRAEPAPDILHLPALWQREHEVWLVDAVIRGDPPGTAHLMDQADLLKLPQRHRSTHRLSLPEGLRWILHAHPEMSAVRFWLWGIEPGELIQGRRLSRPVRRAAGDLARAMLAKLGDGRTGSCY